MERLSTCEQIKVNKNRKSLGTDCGVLDRGIYYLVAIVLKDLREGEYIVINGRKRDFLKTMEQATNGKTFYGYVLQKINENACSLTKWKKWVRLFVNEYQRKVDIIIGNELKHANDILDCYPALLAGIQGIDEEEEYTSEDELNDLFAIQEMIDAVKRFYSGIEGEYRSDSCSRNDCSVEELSEEKIGCIE